MAEEAPQTLVTLGGWAGKTVVYVALGCFIIGSIMGAWGYHTATNSDWLARLHEMELKLVKAESKPPIVKEVVKTVTQTEWAYGDPKIVYIDKATGKETPLDMAYQFNKPDFNFTVNGKLATFTKTDDERFVFDKNMGKMTQTSTASIDIKVPTVDKTKRFGVGAIVSNKGIAPLIEFRPGLLEVGVFYGPDFYGGKISARF